MGPQAIIYFVIAAGSLGLAMSLLFTRYVRRDRRAISSGSFGFFAAFMVLFAVGAAAAGYASLQAGR